MHLLSLWPIEVLTFGLVCLAVGAHLGIPIGYWLAHQPISPTDPECPCQAQGASARPDARHRCPARPGGEEADPR